MTKQIKNYKELKYFVPNNGNEKTITLLANYLKMEDSPAKEKKFNELVKNYGFSGYKIAQAEKCFVEDPYLEYLPHKEIKFIDLFAGIGGMRIAFEKNGGKCVYSNEWNKYCAETYEANFGDKPDGDITKVNAADIPDHQILVAGFPCQPFSIAGVSKKKSLGRSTGFEDKTQGTLFFDVCRIIKEKRPNAFMLENVKNLASHDKGNTFKVIKESLEELDYQIFYRVLDGQYFVPQHRERILIVGFDRKRYGKEIDFEFKVKPLLPKPVVKDILEPKVDKKYTLTDKLWEYLQNYAKKHKEAGNGFGYGIAPLDGITRTLSARYYKDGSEILIAQKNKNPRRLTPRECARLQGFPDDFKIVVSDTQAYKQFGNSVVVPLMTNIAELIVTKLSYLEMLNEYLQYCG